MVKRNMVYDRLMMIAGILAIGSVWGLLECILGGVKFDIVGLPVSMGAVMAGLFGIGFTHGMPLLLFSPQRTAFAHGPGERPPGNRFFCFNRFLTDGGSPIASRQVSVCHPVLASH